MTGHIVTFTGKILEPLNPDPALICIEDIAHALSNSCRFTGHVRKFYSVAQHSFICSYVVTTDALRLTALLHDASEAYLSDIARPIKQQPVFGDVYKAAEHRLEEAIAFRFGIAFPYPPEIKWADDVLLRSEQRDLMPDLLRVPGADYLDGTIAPWLPAEGEERFLTRYYELTEA